MTDLFNDFNVEITFTDNTKSITYKVRTIEQLLTIIETYNEKLDLIATLEKYLHDQRKYFTPCT